jgi:hypothetical protein
MILTCPQVFLPLAISAPPVLELRIFFGTADQHSSWTSSMGQINCLALARFNKLV